MKKFMRIVAALMAAVMVMAFGAASVFAEGELTAEDLEKIQEYYAAMGMEMPSNTDISGGAVSGADVSGSDVSGSDAIGAITTKLLRDYELVEKDFGEFGLSMLVPSLEKLGTIYSDTAELTNALGSQVNINALFDISYNGFTNYVLYGVSADQGVMMAVTYTENNWSHYIGNFADLDADAQERIASGTDLMGFGDGSTASFRVINGTPCLYQEYYDAQYTSMVYVVQAIVDGGIYEVYLQFANPGDPDFDVADQIVNSLKFEGVNPQRYGVANTTTTTVLIVLLAVLFAIVALLAFFIIRFSLFAKASGSDFNIIGFNLPEKQ